MNPIESIINKNNHNTNPLSDRQNIDKKYIPKENVDKMYIPQEN
jgi:hypothetical protein